MDIFIICTYYAFNIRKQNGCVGESVSEQRICSYHCQPSSALCHFLTNFPIKQGVFELPTKSVDNFVDTVWATRAFAVQSLFALNLPKK